MGKRKVGPDGLVSTSDNILKHMKNLKTSKEFRGDKQSSHHLKKEGRITMTRRKKLYRKGSIYLKVRKHQELNDGDAAYMSRLQIYEKCKNKVNNSFSVMRTLYDIPYISWNRIDMVEELQLYLCSLINPDTLNFNEAGEFVSGFVNENIDLISEQHWMLKNAIMLDGFLKAVDDLLLKEDSKCNIEIDLNNISEATEILGGSLFSGSKKSGVPDSKLALWKLCGKHILWFFEKLEAKYSERENTLRTVELKKYVSKPFLFTKKHAPKRFEAINAVYAALMSDFASDKRNRKLYNALTLFHINRYTHIIDLYLMDNFNDTDFPFFRIGGLFTPVVLHEIFNANGNMIKTAFKELCVGQDNEIPAIEVSGDLSVMYFKEREIVFVNELIERLAQTYEKAIFVTERCEADNNKVYTDYIKTAEVFRDFAKDEELMEFLDAIEFPEKLYVGYGNNYCRIYESCKEEMRMEKQCLAASDKK